MTWGFEGAVQIQDLASGWQITLPVVKVTYPSFKARSRCVELVEGESLAWCGDRPPEFPKVADRPPLVVYVVDLKPDQD